MSGNISIVESIIRVQEKWGAPINPSTFLDLAARSESLDMIDYIYRTYFPNANFDVIWSAIQESCKKMSVAVLGYLLDKIPVLSPADYTTLVNISLENKSYRLIAYFLDLGVHVDPEGVFEAIMHSAWYGNLDTSSIVGLLKYHPPLDKDDFFRVMTNTISNKNIDVIQFMFENASKIMNNYTDESIGEFIRQHIRRVVYDGPAKLIELFSKYVDLGSPVFESALLAAIYLTLSPDQDKNHTEIVNLFIKCGARLPRQIREICQLANTKDVQLI
jgi:hypothetical protein